MNNARLEEYMAILKAGDEAPKFTLKNQDGQAVKLADFQGRKLLVYFYPRADTPGCTKQACSIRDAEPDLTVAGVAAVGISPDTPEKLRKFADKHGLAFPLLSDEDHAVAQSYGAWGEKKMYGKTSEGIIRSSFLINEQGKLVGAWYKVKPEQTVPKAKQAMEVLSA
jgi:thioredoxin-dependent peroxiredoxin